VGAVQCEELSRLAVSSFIVGHLLLLLAFTVRFKIYFPGSRSFRGRKNPDPKPAPPA